MEQENKKKEAGTYGFKNQKEAYWMGFTMGFSIASMVWLLVISFW